MGAPRKISRQVVDKLLLARRAGTGKDTCAALVKISPRSLCNWLALGRGMDVSGQEGMTATPLHTELAAGWYKAEDDVEERCISTIMSQIEDATDWHAGELALKLLKSLKPERYSERHDLNGSGEILLRIVEGVASEQSAEDY